MQEHEKVFLQQAQMVNQRDRLINDNGDKVCITIYVHVELTIPCVCGHDTINPLNDY